jgi:hypothetical protein
MFAPRKLLLSTLVLIGASACSKAPILDVAGVTRGVLANETWMVEAEACPATMMAPQASSESGDRRDCAPPQLGACLSACEDGAGAACYGLAIAMQDVEAERRVEQALFQRACRLGIMSGCTNRAAGMEVDGGDDPAALSCAVATYEKACAFDDPWACTMYAMHLSQGQGVPLDRTRARQVLEKSCKFGPADEACIAAMNMKAALEQDEVGSE